MFELSINSKLFDAHMPLNKVLISCGKILDMPTFAPDSAQIFPAAMMLLARTIGDVAFTDLVVEDKSFPPA